MAGVPAGEFLANTDYMWTRTSPLHTYLEDFRRTSGADYFTAWNRVAPVFTQYGYFLIRHHPLAYVRYYVWPSAEGFFWSPLDVFAVYNEGNKTVDSLAGGWFHYTTLRPRPLSATLQGRLLAPMPGIYSGAEYRVHPDNRLVVVLPRVPGTEPFICGLSAAGGGLVAGECLFLHRSFTERFPLPGVTDDRAFPIHHKWNLLLNFSSWSNPQAFTCP